MEPLLAIFSPLLYEKPHYVVKPNGIECLAKLDVTNDISRLVLLHQHETELGFTLKIECGFFYSLDADPRKNRVAAIGPLEKPNIEQVFTKTQTRFFSD